MPARNIIKNIFTSAFGNTTVPMSLPSIMISAFSPIFLCIGVILSLISLIAAYLATKASTSGVLISFETSFLFNNTICFPFSFFSSISMFFRISFIPSILLQSTFLFMHSNATHLYIAPVSILTKFNFSAIIFVIVPFPLPACAFRALRARFPYSVSAGIP